MRRQACGWPSFTAAGKASGVSSDTIFWGICVYLRGPGDGPGVIQLDVRRVLASRSEKEAAARSHYAYLLPRRIHDAPWRIDIDGGREPFSAHLPPWRCQRFAGANAAGGSFSRRLEKLLL
jgi:hypothetical protein